MTKRENFEAIIEVINGSEVENKEELVSVIEHEIELIDRKKAKSKEISEEKRAANLEYEAAISLAMGRLEKPSTVSEIVAEIGEGTVSTQRASYILKTMVADGKVVNTFDKRKSYYALA